MRPIALILSFLTLPMAAQADFQTLSGDQIARTLSGQVIFYEDGEQAFNADGTTRTKYYDGGAQGRWSVEQGQLCQKMSGRAKACFRIARDGDRLRFYEADGRYFTGYLE
ncbi:MAG: hypothetical protein N4A53_13375 [Pelagimonas sp.]|jgi:hypothetical protein|nr:hypothetical protein [Pelagimonas sp.]